MVKVALHDGREFDFEGLDTSNRRDALLASETVDV
jgi:hypothetical protein